MMDKGVGILGNFGRGRTGHGDMRGARKRRLGSLRGWMTMVGMCTS